MKNNINTLLDQGAVAFMSAAVALLVAGTQPFYVPIAFAAVALLASFLKYRLR